jgi:hypothetical protein
VPTPNRHELNYLSPSADTPGATLPLLTWRPFIQSCGSSASRLLHVGNQALPLIAGIDRCRIPSRSIRNFGLTPRHQPGSDPRRQGTDRSPVVGWSRLHGHNHEASDVQSAGIFFQQYGSPQGEHSN